MQGARPPHHFSDVGNQHAAGDWLDEEVVCTGVQDAGNHARVVDGGEDENGGAAELAHRFANLPAVHVGHHQVKQDDVWVFFARELNALRAAVGGDDIKAVSFEQHAHQVCDGGVIVYDKDCCVHAIFPLRLL